MAELTLYTYFRSSAAYRVRIALHLKRLVYDCRPVHLARDGGEHRKPAYLAVNPQGLVPALVDGEITITQSQAIMEYLDETRPAHPLLPEGPGERAHVRALAQMIACDVHPLNNLRVMAYLEQTLKQDETARTTWMCHWMRVGFEAMEEKITGHGYTGAFCFGDQPGMADACLVPQLYNARRYGCDLERFPTLGAIEQRCKALDTFQRAVPENQPDAD